MNTVRIFIAGASGTLGRRLVPQLIARGHHVTGTTRSRADELRALGAEPVIVEPLDAEAVREAVVRAEPDVVVHQLTALAGLGMTRNFDKSFAVTNRLRTEGTDYLIAAARAAGARRLVWQSYAGWPYGSGGSTIKTEDDPLDPSPPAHFRKSAVAMAYLEQAVTDFGGIALRYGAFYGAANDGTIEPVRKRQFPIVGDGDGVWSWIHLDDAASATVLALSHDGPAIFNVVDDDPAPVREWLPVLADALGAKPPRHVPTWLARLLAGEVVTMMSTQARGASNVKAKRELGWTPRFVTWRTGFPAVYSALAAAERQTPRRAPQPSH